MTLFWFAQAIGVVALGFSVFSYLAKTRTGILRTQMFGSLVYILHFGLLSGWTGLAMNAIVAVRNWVFIRKDTQKWASHTAWLYVFIIASLGVLPFIWEGYISLLPALAMVIGIYARWQENPAHIRAGTLIGIALWIPYTISVQSYAGTAANFVLLIAVIYGMLKHDRKGKGESEFLGV
ncbi:YgjV family protein [Patescibacteria group bacterium]|nr:YgjV family protein [Patescibacteria group bacterium]